jgi:hypothetical protein
MLACDIVVQARASRRLSAEEINRLERIVFGAGAPTPEGLETLLLIDAYIEAGDASWSDLLSRAAHALDRPGAPSTLARAA